MTTEQFDALAKLMRLRNSPSREAAYLHMVIGLRVKDAAKKAQCTPQAASNCIARCKAALKLAQIVTN